MPNKETAIKQALEKMLTLAKKKLAKARDKGNEWEICHYENDIAIIEIQLSIISK